MNTNIGLLVVASLLAAVAPLAAHHAFAAVFDIEKKVSLKGVVTKVEWQNPHIWFYFDVKDGNAVTHWQCEGGGPNSLVRQGWTKDSLKQGDAISVEGYRAKDGSNTCNTASVNTADGKRLFNGQNTDR